ncbi:MAG: TonB family protein [candidate division WOR-3 bacterium]
MKPELLISFAGHAVLLAVIVLLGAGRTQRDMGRPQVITVQILSAGRAEPQPVRETARLVEPQPAPTVRPKPQTRKESKPKPQSRQGSETVRRQGLGARVEGASALGYNYYLAQMLDRISANWSDPYLTRSQSFRATIVFVIERDGTLREIALERSSGDRSYDAACLRAVRLTERLPPLPPEFTAPRLKIHLEFEL